MSGELFAVASKEANEELQEEMEFSFLMSLLYRKFLQSRLVIYKHNEHVVGECYSLHRTSKRNGGQLGAGPDVLPGCVLIESDDSGNDEPGTPSNYCCGLGVNVTTHLNGMISTFCKTVEALIIEQDKDESDPNLLKECLDILFDISTDMLEKNCYGCDCFGPMTDIMTELNTGVDNFRNFGTIWTKNEMKYSNIANESNKLAVKEEKDNINTNAVADPEPDPDPEPKTKIENEIEPNFEIKTKVKPVKKVRFE